MRLIDGDALLEKFNRKADIWTALTDEDTASDFAFYCKLADAVEEMPTIGGWISVKDRLPESEQYVILWTKTGVMKYAKYLDDEPHRPWITYDEDGSCRAWDNVVTHWMPLPEPPKEEIECNTD